MPVSRIFTTMTAISSRRQSEPRQADRDSRFERCRLKFLRKSFLTEFQSSKLHNRSVHTYKSCKKWHKVSLGVLKDITNMKPGHKTEMATLHQLVDGSCGCVECQAS